VKNFIEEGRVANYINVFKDFLKLQYGLARITINEIDSVHLYLEIMKLLLRKRLTVEGLAMLNSDRNGLEMMEKKESKGLEIAG
jgi:hypothetical protein